MRHPLTEPLLLITIVLILPMVLLATVGDSFGEHAARWQAEPPPAPLLAAAVIAVLASDVVLPIPSGPLVTLAGSQLGIVAGAASGCLGMTLGAAIAFAVVRRWGQPAAAKLSSPEGLAELEAACRDHGPWMLAVTRPLPVIAEAAALLAGSLGMPWNRFLPIVVVTNAAIAVAYAALGSLAVEQGWLPLAVGLAIAAPLAAAALYRRNVR